MEDHRLTLKQIAANAGISVESVDTILHDDTYRNFKNTGIRRWGLFMSFTTLVKQKKTIHNKISKCSYIIIVFYTQFVITVVALSIQNAPYSPLRESKF